MRRDYSFLIAHLFCPERTGGPAFPVSGLVSAFVLIEGHPLHGIARQKTKMGTRRATRPLLLVPLRTRTFALTRIIRVIFHWDPIRSAYWRVSI